VPKFHEPIIGTEAAIHQIAAPNLGLTQLDNDLTKVSVQAFSLEKPRIQVSSIFKMYNNVKSIVIILISNTTIKCEKTSTI
jgi:hypothetical protein